MERHQAACSTYGSWRIVGLEMKPVDVDIVSYNQVVRMFHGETDRGAAVLAASFLENFLAKYLRSAMIEDSAVDDLFTGFGPFADFNKRIETAYALGLITKDDRRDLKLIQKIRNHFAHTPTNTSFDTRPISDWISALSLNRNLTDEIIGGKTASKNRMRYLITIGHFCAGIHNSMLKHARKPDQLAGKKVSDYLNYWCVAVGLLPPKRWRAITAPCRSAPPETLSRLR